ncbi:MAG: hypothetical protein ABI910_11370 [Gemmatimonadota bacterium]
MQPTRRFLRAGGDRIHRILARAGRPLGTALVALALAAPAVRAQALPDSAFDARTTAELRRLLADSRNAGLPDAPLLNRIRQGAARHVSGDRMLALVRAHADSMRAARVALGARASADELDAGASALHAGATRADLHRLRSARPAGTATTAIIVLTDLLWRGVPSADAADAIAELAGRSTDKALLALQGAVAREGAPASAQRLQSLVELFAAPSGDQPPAAGRGPRRPIPVDTLPPLARRASLALVSLSAPTGAAPRAVLAEGGLALPLGTAWEVAPASALRLDEDGTRWSAALKLSRQLQTSPTIGARLWLRGELRSPVAHTRNELPLQGGLALGNVPLGRGRDFALLAGTELRRRVRGWTVSGELAVGHTRFSSLETVFVPRELPIVPDTLTPRPDTLAQTTIFEPRNVWRALGASTMRGGLAMRRGPLLVEGAVVRRLGAAHRGSDSLAAGEQTFFTFGAERQLSPRVAMVAQWTSHDPSSVTGSLALNDARWRLGVRLASISHALSSPLPDRRATGRDASDAPQVELFADSSGSGGNGAAGNRVRLRVRMSGARSVQVEGDLTAWTPVSLLAEDDGTFTGSFVVPGPIVRLRLRADGGNWVTPRGVPTQRDDFGDLVAVYVLDG